MSEFTKGPWVFNGWERVRPVNGKDDGTDDICHVYGAGKPIEANGKLLAAAPELYEALWDLLEWGQEPASELYKHGWNRAVEKAEAALKKASGE
jgi:hypothetical protein